MKNLHAIYSWACGAAIAAVAAWACYEMMPVGGYKEAMRNASSPARMTLESERLRKAMGPSVPDAIRIMEGPEYDVSRSMDVE